MPNALDTLRMLAVRAPHIAEMAELLANKQKPASPMALARTAANVARPGAGKHLEAVVRATGRMIYGGVPEIDFGDSESWSDLITHLDAMKSGVCVIFGSRGYGKSVLALRLAQRWHEIHGYRVETINLHREDRKPWATAIDMQRFTARIVKVMRWLGQETQEDTSDDGLTEDDLNRSKKKVVAVRHISDGEIQRLKRRVIVVDEAKTLFSSLAATGQQTNREATRNLVNQVRHLDTILICICQQVAEMPDYLQNDAVQFFKFANSEVIRRDYKQGSKRDNKERWTQVLTALHAVQYGAYPEPIPNFYDEKAREALRNAAKAHVHWQEPYNTIQAWSYVVAPTLGGHGFVGLMPNGMVESANDDPNVIDLDPEEWSAVAGG